MSFILNLFRTKEEILIADVKEGRVGITGIGVNNLTAEICWAAFDRYPPDFAYIPNKFKDAKMCDKAIKYGYWLFREVPIEFKTKEMCEDVLKRDPSLFPLLPECYKDDFWMYDSDVKRDRVVAFFLKSDEKSRTKDMCIKVVQCRNDLIKDVPEEHLESVLRDMQDSLHTLIGQIPVKHKKFVVKYCVANPIAVQYLSADMLDEATCVDLVKQNPQIIAYLQDRYKTDEVCMMAFLKNRNMVCHIPNRTRVEEMWEEVVSREAYVVNNIPIDRISENFLRVYTEKRRVKLSLFSKKQREIIYPVIMKYMIGGFHLNRCIEEEPEYPYLINELIDYLVNTPKNGQHIDIYLFINYELTGEQVNKLTAESKQRLVKLTNMEEKHRDILYADGEIKDIYPFSKSNSSQGGLYCTTQCHEKDWSHYDHDIGKMYWRRTVTFKSSARVFILSHNKIKSDSFILGPREKL